MKRRRRVNRGWTVSLDTGRPGAGIASQFKVLQVLLYVVAYVLALNVGLHTYCMLYVLVIFFYLALCSVLT